jgi:hypothetical protein
LKYFALVLLVAASVAAQQQPPVVHHEQPVYVTAIELVADVRDAKGEIPLDLKASDFIVLEDGVEQNVIGLVTSLRSMQHRKPSLAKCSPLRWRTNRLKRPDGRSSSFSTSTFQSHDDQEARSSR